MALLTLDEWTDSNGFHIRGRQSPSWSIGVRDWEVRHGSDALILRLVSTKGGFDMEWWVVRYRHYSVPAAKDCIFRTCDDAYECARKLLLTLDTVNRLTGKEPREHRT